MYPRKGESGLRMMVFQVPNEDVKMIMSADDPRRSRGYGFVLLHSRQDLGQVISLDATVSPPTAMGERGTECCRKCERGT